MADITLFWCFWKNKILDRMMEFQVKFCYHSGLRLWRTGMLFSTKSKGHKSKFRISWMCRYCFYDLKVLFWWPNKHLFWCKSSLNTLYVQLNLYLNRCIRLKTNCSKSAVAQPWSNPIILNATRWKFFLIVETRK